MITRQVIEATIKAYEKAINAIQVIPVFQDRITTLTSLHMQAGLCNYFACIYGIVSMNADFERKMVEFSKRPEGQNDSNPTYTGFALHFFPGTLESGFRAYDINEMAARLQTRVDFLKMYNEL